MKKSKKINPIYVGIACSTSLCLVFFVLFTPRRKSNSEYANVTSSVIAFEESEPKEGTTLVPLSKQKFSYKLKYYSHANPPEKEVYCIVFGIANPNSKPYKLFYSIAKPQEQSGIVACDGEFLVPESGKVSVFVSLREAGAMESAAATGLKYIIQK